MIWILAAVAATIYITKLGASVKPRPPRTVREAIARNTWTH